MPGKFLTEARIRGLPAHPGAIWRRALILALLCGALAAAAASADLHAALMALLESGSEIIARHPLLGALLFVVFAALSAMLAFVSAAVVVPVAVYVWGAPLSMLLLWLGWILGGACAYGVGRLLGRQVVAWLTMQAALERLEQRIRAGASFGLIVLIQFALPSEIPGYVLGVTRYDFGRYLLAFAVAELPYAVLTVLLGENFVARRGGMVLAAGAALVVAGVGAYYLLRRKWYTGAGGQAAH
jgi:uncharacterized membrane protein YdjX (TVP38/TMEM64 family)